MGFALPSGVVNTGSLYIYAPAVGAVPLGPYVKHVGDQILVVIDYFASGGTPVASFSFAVDVSTNPQLVIAYPQIDSTGHTLSFLLSGGIVGQQYNITINTQYTVSPGVTAGRAYHLIINIPSSDGDIDIINPVPAIYNQIPLWGGGYVNTAMRTFWGPVAPVNPNVSDQWYDTANIVLKEWVSDGTDAFWMTISSGNFVSEAPLDGQLYVRSSGAWVLSPDTTPVKFGALPPTTSAVGGLWFDDTAAQMYVLYRDVNGTTAWVPVVNQAGAAGAPPPSPTAPANTAAPVVTGAGTTGSTLTTTNGSWTNSPTTFAYQWTRNGLNISGATASTYVLTVGDAGTNIRCNVTASNASGSATAGSNALTILPTAPVNSVPPVISGSTTLGSTLTTTDGTWNGGPTFTYLWQRDGVSISGATATTYVVVTADQGHSLNAVVTATNVAGSGSMSSNTLAIPAFTFPAANLKALYSIRKCGAGYGGPCFQAFRPSDSATLDIGFVAATGLVDFAAALAFTGSQPIFVNKWYDQSGAGLDLTYILTGAEYRPQLNLMNGKPWLSFLRGGLRSATAPTLNADLTVGCVAQMQSDIVSVPFSQFDASGNGWFLFGNGSGTRLSVGSTPGTMNFFSSPGGIVIADAGRYFSDTNRYVGKRTGGSAFLYVNGTQTATGAAANGGTSTAGISIGQNQAAQSLDYYGLIGELYAYGSTAGAGGALSDANRLAIDTNQAAIFPSLNFATPYSGTSCVEFGTNQYINCGPVLAYERTNSWTVFAAIQLFAASDVNAPTIIYTNVPAAGPAYPGHEIWLDANGRIRVRILNNFTGPPVNYLGVVGTTYLIDGKKHTVAYSYNGSSLASGVKIYIDGVLETTTVEIDALTGSIIGGVQNFFIGNQDGFLTLDMLPGTLSFIQVDNVVRSASYIATNFTGSGQLPPADANTDLRLLLNAGSGTAAADTSGHSRNGTLASATMWVP